MKNLRFKFFKFGIVLAMVLISVSLILFHYKTKKDSLKSFDYNSLQTGDILFCRGSSIQSYVVVLLNPKGNNFSHCGVVCKEDKTNFIIHSTPTPIDRGKGRLVKENLSQFIAFNKVSMLSVYRIQPKQEDVLQKSMLVLNKFLKQHVPFDDMFRLDNDKFYCTEIIWRMYKDVGLEVIDSNDFNKIIYPSDLMKSAYFKRILTL